MVKHFEVEFHASRESEEFNLYATTNIIIPRKKKWKAANLKNTTKFKGIPHEVLLQNQE